MKFGKSLQSELQGSNPEWAPFWLNYKRLKARIKVVCQAIQTAGASRREISECAEEVAFFKDLQEQLKKISVFFSGEERRCVLRFHQFRAVLKEVKKREPVDVVEAQRLMYGLVHFYRECIRLERFAVMNYQGFSKILKKHDKKTGYHTRTKYMRRKVNLSTFSNYPVLLQVLEGAEQMFQDVDKDARLPSGMAMPSIDFSMHKMTTDGGRSMGMQMDMAAIRGSTASTISTPLGMGSSLGSPSFLFSPLTPNSAPNGNRPLLAPVSSLGASPSQHHASSTSSSSSGHRSFGAAFFPWRSDGNDGGVQS